MSEIRYCSRCNAIYKYNNVNLCTSCLRAYDEILAKTEKYLRDHPMANIFEIEKAIGEKKKDLLYLIRMGRLSFVSEDDLLSCSRCGKKISSGKYCKKCSEIISSQLRGTLDTTTINYDRSESRDSSSDSINKKMFTIYRHTE